MGEIMLHNCNRSGGGLCALFLIFGVAGVASADQLFFFSGDLRTDATVLSCGTGCTLGPGNTDGDYAQWAAAVYSFNVAAPASVQAITYGYGGGTSLTGTLVPSGGLEPYLSLFDSGGNFLIPRFPESVPRERIW
jgi:hypothetical protein